MSDRAGLRWETLIVLKTVASIAPSLSTSLTDDTTTKTTVDKQR